jgi:hypothetical protein
MINDDRHSYARSKTYSFYSINKNLAACLLCQIENFYIFILEKMLKWNEQRWKKLPSLINDSFIFSDCVRKSLNSLLFCSSQPVAKWEITANEMAKSANVRTEKEFQHTRERTSEMERAKDIQNDFITISFH